MPRSITIRTISDFLDYEHGLAAYCNNARCLHWAALDLSALAARFGRNTDPNDIRSLLRCSRCGGTDCGLQVRAPVPDVTYPRHEAMPEIIEARTNVRPPRQPFTLAMRRYRVRAMEAATYARAAPAKLACGEPGSSWQR